MKNICIFTGARPNFVKVAPLVRAIESSGSAEWQLVYAGSENDPTLESSLFDDLQMARPQYYLGVVSDRLNEITGSVIALFDRHLDAHPADVVIVVDDLASTMAAAIVTKKRGIKLAHLVAGTRSFDITMPKEVNRLVIDSLSDYLFTAGVKSNSVAAREQGEASHTYMVGNILIDSLRYNRTRFRKPTSLEVEEGKYLVLTLNRKALLTDESTLKGIIDILVQSSKNIPIVAPLREDAKRVVGRLDSSHCLIITESLSYLEFGWLTAHAKAVITDSGNVAEEATFNGVPCITLNSYTEHSETVTHGTNELVGGDTEKLRDALCRIENGQWKKGSLPDRWDGRTAERIVQVLTSD